MKKFSLKQARLHEVCAGAIEVGSTDSPPVGRLAVLSEMPKYADARRLRLGFSTGRRSL
jgi:hypothetical protein